MAPGERERQPRSRHLAAALLVGAVIAAGLDACLQLALGAIGPSWGVSAVAGRALLRARWLVAALLLWASAPVITSAFAQIAPECHSSRPISRGEAYAIAGTAMLAAPLLWLLATWIITSVTFTLGLRWGVDSCIFSRALLLLTAHHRERGLVDGRGGARCHQTPHARRMTRQTEPSWIVASLLQSAHPPRMAPMTQGGRVEA